MRVLYDAWDWAYAPTSPAARRLARLLERLPAEVEPVLALPAAPAFATAHTVHLHPTPNTPWGRLRWEQRLLPYLARRLGASILHAFHGVPWRSPVPVVHDGIPPSAHGPLPQRLRAALAQAGRSTAQPLAGLPPPYHPPSAPPTLHDAASWVLAYGPWDDTTLLQMLRAWAWAAPAIGEGTSLALYGLSPAQTARLREWLAEAPWRETVRPLPALPPTAALGLLHQAVALLQVGWRAHAEETIGAALALGVPIVGEERPELNALVGPAAYLTPPGDARTLGAALITVVVEESLAEQLRRAAAEVVERARNARWAEALYQLYSRLASPTRS